MLPTLLTNIPYDTDRANRVAENIFDHATKLREPRRLTYALIAGAGDEWRERSKGHLRE